MVTVEGRRLHMVSRLQEVLGEDVTETLLDYLPPGGWANVATRGDLAELRGELRGDMAELRGDMAELRSDLHAEMVELRGDLNRQMVELRGEFTGQMVEAQRLAHRDARSMLFAMLAVFTAYSTGLVAAVRLH